MRKIATLIGFFGPKGGVGKSVLASNTAIAAALAGYSTAIVDVDLGAANLNTLFGIKKVKYTLGDFFLNNVDSLFPLFQDAGVNNLDVICGSDLPGAANVPFQKKIKLIRHLKQLPHDVVILDAGAGAGYNPIDFMQACDIPLLVTTPQVQSILNVYAFVKTSVYRRLTFQFKRRNSIGLLNLLNASKDKNAHPELATMDLFFKKAFEIDFEGADAAMRRYQRFSPYIALNRIRNTLDLKAAYAVRSLMAEKLNIVSKRILTCWEDDAVHRSDLKQVPVLLKEPNARICNDVRELVKIISPDVKNKPAEIVSLSSEHESLIVS